MRTPLLIAACVCFSLLFLLSTLFVRVNDLYDYGRTHRNYKRIDYKVCLALLAISIALLVAAKVVE